MDQHISLEKILLGQLTANPETLAYIIEKISESLNELGVSNDRRIRQQTVRRCLQRLEQSALFGVSHQTDQNGHQKWFKNTHKQLLELIGHSDQPIPYIFGLDTILQNLKSNSSAPIVWLSDNLGLQHPKVDPDIYAYILKCIEERVWLQFDYQSQKTHRVIPICILYRGDTAYLCAMMDYTLSSHRFFAIHRIKSVVMPDQLEPTGLFKSALKDTINTLKHNHAFEFGHQGKIQLKLRILRPYLHVYLSEHQFAHQQIDDRMPHAPTLSATVDWTWALEWWILARANHLEVLEPVELRQHIQKRLAEAAQLYQPTSTTHLD